MKKKFTSAPKNFVNFLSAAIDRFLINPHGQVIHSSIKMIAEPVIAEKINPGSPMPKTLNTPAFIGRQKFSGTKLILSLLAFFVMALPAKAQFDIAIGAGTAGNTNTGYPCPLQDYFEGGRGQYLFLASELNRAGMAAGTITSIRFQVTTLNSFAGTIEEFAIKIGSTNLTTLDLASWVGLSNQVFGPVDYTPTSGINSFVFSTPFTWDGVSNIVIEVCNGDSRSLTATTWTGNPTVTWTTGLAFNASHTYRADASSTIFPSCSSTQTANTGSATTRPNIIFAWIPSNLCSSTPAPGNASSSVTSVCPATPFSLSLPSVSPAGGLEFQWQSAPASTGPWTDIPGANAATYIATQTATTWYRCVVTCSAAGDAPQTSGSVQVTIKPFLECYCTSGASSTADEDIFNVSFSNLNNNSTCTSLGTGPTSILNRYADYRSGTGAPGPAQVLQGFPYNLSVTIGTCGGLFDNAVAVWIDYNQNGVFEASEKAYVSAAITRGPHTETGIITIPANATPGITTMRVVNDEKAPANISPCGTYTWGETEDYLVQVIVPQQCSGAPTPGSASASSSAICSGSSVNLSLVGATLALGLSYQWQTSPDNNTWTSIPGGTTQNLTHTPTGNTWYRCVITCANGNISSPSASVFVSVKSCINMPATGSVSTCDALFFDSGGPNANYGNNEFRVFTVFPSIAVGKVKVVFTEFNTENNYDALRIYNGSDTFAGLINSGLPAGFNPATAPAGSFYGNNSPGTRISTAPNGALTFVFRSDNDFINNFTGWAATLSCELPPPCSGAGNPGSTLVNGTANLTSTQVCVGSTVRLAVQNPQNFLGINYQWQVSTDNVTWNNTSSADTNLTYTPNITATRWFRCLVTCSTAPTSTSNSIPVRVILDSTCINMPVSGSWTIDCNGAATTFYDDGGATGNYSNGQNRTFTIKPNVPGKRLSAAFSTWNLEAGYDFLTIHDGNSTASPQIGRYSVSSPLLVTSSAPDGSLTFVFTSDNVGNFSGWAAALSCEIPPDCISAPTPFDPGQTLATNVSVCSGSSTILSVQNSNYSNMSFEWEVSPDSINWTRTGVTDTLPNYTTTITQLRYFRCKVTCNSTGFIEYTVPVKISVTSAGTITSRTGGSVCTDGTVALAATPSAGTILWYADSTGGFPIRQGNSYTTPFINTTTSYYVSSVVDGGNFSGGRPSTVNPPSLSTLVYGIGFTASSSFRLVSVKVYSPTGSTGTFSISLFSGTATSGTPLYTPVTFIPSAGWNTVTLNWVITPGNYTIARTTTTGGSLGRHLSTAPNAYPYAIGGRLLLTNGVTGNIANTDYNYFYDWNITGLCESPRLPVVATVSQAPDVTVLGNDPICAGGTISLNASSTNSNYSYNWLDNNGNSVGSGNRYTSGILNDTITLRLTGADVTAGSPFNGCRDTFQFDVIVNPVPSTVAVSPATATVCSSPVATKLTASGGLINGVQQTIVWSPAANLFLDSLRTTPYVAGSNALVVWAAPISNVTYIATAGTTCQRSGNAALSVVPYGPLNVSIASNRTANTFCAGNSITFTATPPTGLPSPTYRWQRKTGASWVDVGAFSATSTYTPTSPVTGEIFRAIIKASTTCNPSGVDTALSNQITITINPTPTVTINGPASVCSGSTNNQYTATISPVGTTTYAWSIAPSGAATVSGASTATFTINNPTAPFTVNLAATIGGCTGNATGLGVGVNTNTSNSVAAGSSLPGPICAGTSVTFTATPTNGGTPWYQWQLSTDGGVNYSNIAGANAATHITTALPSGDLRVRVRMRSSLTCPLPDTANSSPVSIVVNPIPSASTISGPASVCAGSTNNTYSINILPAGATSSSQTWSVSSNGTISGSTTGTSVNINATGAAGTNFTITANIFRNGCPATITSSAIPINATVTSGVSITGYTPGSSICPGVANPLTAVPSPGSLPSPVYQWQLSTNGGTSWTNVATGNTYSPTTALGNNGDSIRVILVSSGNSCATTPDTAGVRLIISNSGTASVTLSNTAACTGQTVTYTAAALNTSNPTYNFYFNGVLKQSGSSITYDTTAAAALNNSVRCEVVYTSCGAGQATIQSNTITISSLLTAPTVNISGCSSIVTTGQVVSLSTGAGQTSYQWIRDGVDIGGSTTSSISTAIPANYAVRVTAANGCVVTSSVWALADLRTSPLPNGTYSIPGTGCNSFPDLATVVTRLNTYGISGSGGVVFNIDGAHTETAPAGGFALTANGSAANPIIFQKSGSGSPVFTANASLISGSLTDAVIKLIGSDHITIKGLTLRENPSNTTTAAATNNMTEFGVALFRSSVTDGAQNDSIIGNAISLNRAYANTFGVYSNTNHSATDVGTGVVPTSAAGANSNIRIHGNSISNVNFGIAMAGDSSAGRFYDQNVDIGGTSAATGNTLTNWGGQNVASSFRALPLPNATGGNTYGIFSGNQVSSNISNNTLTSANLNTASAVFTRGIWKSFSQSPAVSLSDSITSNEISITASYTSGTYNLDGIIVQGISALATGSLSVNGNRLLNFNIASGSNPTATLINLGSNTVLVAAVNVNNNVMRGYSSTSASGGGFTGIQFLSGASVVNTLNINNNQFGGSAASDSIKTGAGNITIINNSGGSGVVNRNINNNTISGIRTVGTLTCINTTAGSSANSVSSNSISGLRAGGATLVGIQVVSGTTLVTCNQNTMDNFSASATNSAVYGYLTTSPVTITSNNLTNFSLTNTAGTGGIFGINHSSATTALTATSNTFSGYASASGGTSVVSAVYINNVTTANISKNRIFNLSNSNAAATQFVNAIDLRGTSGTTVNIVNNFISDLRMTAGSNGDGVRGISVNSNVASGVVNLYYNTIYLKAASSGTGFGSSGVYHFAQATTNSNLTLRNNIIVNESTPTGSALVVALRRSASSQTNYSNSSNNNVYFAGAPATNRLLYFDNTNSSQSISAMQTAIGGNKELLSLSTLPIFVNTSAAPFDLHLKASVNCASDGRGDNSGILIPDDIDGDSRSVLSPFLTDVGADEFISTGLGEGIWAGVNTNWFDPENWCGRVPTAETNITINAGLSNYPNIDAAGALANNIVIAAGAQLNMTSAGTFTTSGSWTNNGAVQSAGLIRLASAAGAQSFPGGTSGTVSVGTLEVSNSGGVTVNNNVTITDLLKPLVGNITLSDTITLRSTLSATAAVGQVVSGTGFAYSGSGTFLIERFISDGRKWRHLSIPVNNPALTIRQAWQEGAASSASNPRPGFGMQITDNNSSTYLANGFDAVSPGGPSMKYFDSTTQTYIGVPSTSSPIRNWAGYMAYVRGDRTCLTSNSATTSTTLRVTGPIYTGNRVFNIIPSLSPSTPKFVSIGNPYPSAINFGQLTNVNIFNNYYLWDPKELGSYGVGGNVTVTELVPGSGDYRPTPPTTSYPDVNTRLQSGQAMFVYNPTSSAGSLTFSEASKATGSRNVFRPGSGSGQHMLVMLRSVNPDGSIRVHDGFRVIFDDRFSNAVDYNDAVKMMNATENFAVMNNKTRLIVEKRKPVRQADSVLIDLTGMRMSSYRIDIECVNMHRNNVDGWLVDRHTGTRTPLNLNGEATYSFSLSAGIVAATAPDRFFIVFRKSTRPREASEVLLAASPDKGDVQLKWSVNDPAAFSGYEILHEGEESVGQVKVGFVNSSELTIGETDFSWNHKEAGEGKHVYQIKALPVMADQDILLSNKSSLLLEEIAVPEFTVSPNPVENREIKMQARGLKTGRYELQVVNTEGKILINRIYDYYPGAGNWVIKADGLPSGNYFVNIRNINGKIIPVPVFLK